MTTPDMNDWNEQIKAEFRANAGIVGGPFDGAPMLILHTTGAKSGLERENPLCYLPDGDRMVIFASKGGAPTDPHWFLNLKANPEVTVEVGSETVKAVAAEVTGADRDALYNRQVEAMPQFGDYQKDNPRLIPVVALTRV